MQKNRNPWLDAAKNAGLLLGLMMLVYVPTFAIAGRFPLAARVPATILLSLAFALALIALFVRLRDMTLAEFGLKSCAFAYGIRALLLGLVLGIAASWATSQVHEIDPLAGIPMTQGLMLLYFGVGAPLQEELIFRGLLQSVLARQLGSSASPHVPALTVALLFALVHLPIGPVTAACALVLGMVAGELRLRSGSLAPGIVVHVLFNLPGIFGLFPSAAS